MKLLKPNWVNHDDKPIFSVDIHPTGKRFATGGQGGDSGRVVVWNLNPVLYESVELDPNVPKMLCQMDNHLACVNCVRWSNNGRYLASGGDDKLVMVWALTGGPSTILGGKQNAETWRCVSTLRGHAGDVLDLAWSPLDKWLASCSIDNSIIIWNAEKFPEMVSVLNGHTGLVKGVAWDPVGKYLASQSDDKTLRVWKTADWAQEYVVTEPFEECGGTTHVLRLSWSPDGQYVVSAHAMNGGGPTAQVVERDGWRCEKDFVGHRKAVICVRFNSNIFVKEGKKCCCAAVGSRDRALSIWLTSLKRPLVVINDLFNDSVLDISWSSDGLNLLACSSDGSVACIQFTNKEIGTPLTVDEKNAFYEKIYGKCLVKEGGSLSGSSLLLECPEILDAREKTQQLTSATTEVTQISKPVVSSSNGPLCSTPVRPMDRQIETRTSDGKRRITPVFIPLTQQNNESMGGSGPVPEACFSTSSQSKSRIRVERRDDIIIHPNVSNHATSANSSSSKNDDTVCDPRLKKRCVSSLPGPCVSVNETWSGGRVVDVPAPPPLVPVPVLGAAGPVVRSAGTYRVVLSSRTVVSLVAANSRTASPLWESPLPAPATCLSATAEWLVATTEDGGLHAWGLRRGGVPVRVLPPVVLGAPGVRTAVVGHRAVVLTARGDLTVYCLRTATAETGPVAVPGGGGAGVAGVSVLECGAPVVRWSGPGPGSAGPGAGRCQVYVVSIRGWVWWFERPPRVPPAAPRPWLESQVAVCRALGVPREYRQWSLALTSHLAAEGPEWALRALLDDMLGPTHSSPGDTRWEDAVLGIRKHHLLEEMLAIVIKHLKWQRLYTEYNDQLKDLTEANRGLLNGH